MTNEEVHEIIGDVPHMTLPQADRLRAFMMETRPQNVLELGFKHGVSTCYIANALADIGGGRVTAIDLAWASHANPDIGTLLDRIGQRDRVDVYFEHTSYTWRMMKMIEEDPAPRFDFCYLDGAHDWFVDGFAFFLVDRLLHPGGWIIFDDMEWTYAGSPTMRDSDRVQAMPREERETPQVRKVYDLLVKPHPSYGEFRVEGGWGYARKRPDAPGQPPPVRREIVVQRERVGLGALAARLVRRMLR